MRVLNGSNEIEGKCSECGAKFAYSVGDVFEEGGNLLSYRGPYLLSNETTISARDFLKQIKEDPVFGAQFTSRQLNIMKKHPDWCCNILEKKRQVVCPCCKRVVYVSSVMESLEIHPRGTFDGGYEFDKFNPIPTIKPKSASRKNK